MLNFEEFLLNIRVKRPNFDTELEFCQEGDPNCQSISFYDSCKRERISDWAQEAEWAGKCRTNSDYCVV